LSVSDEQALLDYAAELADADVTFELVHEPDIGNQATALAVAPSSFNARFSSLPLQGKELAMT
jgi:hypothetical protein